MVNGAVNLDYMEFPERPQDIPQEVGDDVEGFVPVPQVHEGFAQEPQDGWAAMPTQMESAFPQGRHVSFAEQMGIPEQSYQTVVYGAAEMSNLRHSMGMEMPMGMGGEFLQGQAMVSQQIDPNQQLPGWQPAHPQNQHHPSLGALEQHANQYGRPQVLAPPHLHRGSSDEISPTTSSFPNTRVPIEREKRGSASSGPRRNSSREESPAVGGDQAMVVQQTGPMSSSVSIPQRPRPGRKPIPQEDAADRRRLQNRLAQRNFRDKRQQKLAEAVAELEENKIKYQNSLAEMKRQMNENRQSYHTLEERSNAQMQSLLARAESAERRAQQAEQRNQDLEKQLQSLKTQQQQLPSLANFRPSQTPTQTVGVAKELSTPPTSDNGMMEVDFTNFGRSNQYSYGLSQTVTQDSNQMDYTVREEDHCGFCTDVQNCACAQEKARERAVAAEKPAPVSVPGSCDQCRADPVRAQACRDMAKSTQIGPRPPTSDGTRALGVTSNSSMPPPPRTTCASMVDSFNKYGERTASIATLFGGQRLNTYPAPNGGGYEFEEKQAAEVLSNLSRRSTIAESPRSVAESVNDCVSPHTQSS